MRRCRRRGVGGQRGRRRLIHRTATVWAGAATTLIDARLAGRVMIVARWIALVVVVSTNAAAGPGIICYHTVLTESCALPVAHRGGLPLAFGPIAPSVDARRAAPVRGS